MADSDDIVGDNNLLRAMNSSDAALLRPLLSRRRGERGQVLYEPGDVVRQVHFPLGPSLISYLVVMEDGRAIETALIGREGAVGGIVSQGRLPAFSRAEVQFPGYFLRVELGELERLKSASPTLGHLFARYADCLMAQVFQITACNATHTIEQRAARWLIAAMDRTGDHRVPLTQEQLAAMLGVGRSYISRVIQKMKAMGVLETKRGHLLVHDTAALQSLECGCQAAIHRHFDEVLKGVYPTEGDQLIAGTTFATA